MWLLLIHQLPPDPSYLRVKIRRRLRSIGAVLLKNTVYVLPKSESAREDFEWLSQEIRASGGEAVLCEAHLIGGLLDEEVRDLFRGERDAEYAEVVRAVQEIPPGIPNEAFAAQLVRARRRLAAITKLDFFESAGRAAAERAIENAAARIAGPPQPTQVSTLSLEALRGRVWVTRRGVHVDRMACAWLIRRFVDPDARFRFVDPDGYRPGPDEIRYDMYEAEFTHVGDRCTFEVLSALVAPDDAALSAVAEIVHDIDLGDRKFGRGEAAGIERLIAGIRALYPSDSDRLGRASEVFEGLYQALKAVGEP